ncbi:MAG: bifunctional 5,10-methylene-tetrahydrofolate dehydrogenase/5,10-methylene-tetrahydrofolate cyclohydrolase [Synergistaceae bacterium]|jgi:methylenetetrahydrofolate dehydrogenase (NADP+)/methenyltetrahydrofolate cyclohydrolase|nr:bifunctional 5,10-methylene-tetrahydrofolate dehydrogenase/5,10-methylene-tetrahydrofolate cyclohydrolase [Synergistaceae bacterium]
MTTIMKGAPVAAWMKETLEEELAALRRKGIEPRLAVVRVGARPDDLAYERGALKRFEGLDIGAQVFEFPENIDHETFAAAFAKIDALPDVHGILLFRPLPGRLDEDAIKKMIDPLKDVDGMSPFSAAKVFSGDESGFAPCTPSAVMEMLDHYGVELAGRNVAVVGRSMVVGRPLAMLMLRRNATVTICHTKTKNMDAICKNADIVVAAAGKARMLSPAFVSGRSVVVDVGINVDENGQLCGDVDYDAVSPLVSMISPVPGGVGAVTTSVLAKHVLKAAALLNG